MLYFELLARTKRGMTGESFTAGVYAKDELLVEGEIPPGLVSYCANRIWCEQDGKVTLVKHKQGDAINWKVDMKEFAWIKLTAEML